MGPASHPSPASTEGRRRPARIAWLVLRGIAGAVAFAAAFSANWSIPARHLPWAMLDLAEEVGPLTRVKLDVARGQTCRTILGNGAVRFREVQEQTSGAFCSKRDAITLGAGTAPLTPRGAVMTCNQALAYALWERQVVQPAAQAHFGKAVTRIDHYGTYACRRMYGASNTAVSQHASANALDVASFRLADGRIISVLRDWNEAGEKGEFLRAVRDGACGLFSVTLSPEYNAAHRDHLHLDMGRGRICS